MTSYGDSQDVERSVLQDVLARIEKKPLPERMPDRCLVFLRAKEVPEKLISIFRECAYLGPIRVGPLYLDRVAELAERNEETEENRPCVDHGFLVVGSGLNGDLVALHLHSGRMAFIDHADLWERNFERFADCVVWTPLSFDDLWAAAASDPTFPRDCWDAEKRWPPSYAAYQKSLEHDPASKLAVDEMVFIVRELQRLGGSQGRAFKPYQPAAAANQIVTECTVE